MIADEALDDHHDGHGHEDDEAGDHHEGAGEGGKGLVVDDGVHGPGHELDQGRDERQAGEDPTNLRLLHRLAATEHSVNLWTGPCQSQARGVYFLESIPPLPPSYTTNQPPPVACAS